jgi:hypothetical protein
MHTLYKHTESRTAPQKCITEDYWLLKRKGGGLHALPPERRDSTSTSYQETNEVPVEPK